MARIFISPSTLCLLQAGVQIAQNQENMLPTPLKGGYEKVPVLGLAKGYEIVQA